MMADEGYHNLRFKLDPERAMTEAKKESEKGYRKKLIEAYY